MHKCCCEMRTATQQRLCFPPFRINRLRKTSIQGSLEMILQPEWYADIPTYFRRHEREIVPQRTGSDGKLYILNNNRVRAFARLDWDQGTIVGDVIQGL